MPRAASARVLKNLAADSHLVHTHIGHHSIVVYTGILLSTKGLPVDHQEKSERVAKALNNFRIEIPSWGFATPGLALASSCRRGHRIPLENARRRG